MYTRRTRGGPGGVSGSAGGAAPRVGDADGPRHGQRWHGLSFALRVPPAPCDGEGRSGCAKRKVKGFYFFQVNAKCENCVAYHLE